MGEKWRLFLWAHGGPCHLASALLLGGGACWVPVFRLWPPAGLLCRSYLRDLVSLCLLPPTQAAALCRKPARTMPLRLLLISAPPVLLPRAGAAPVLPAFLLDVFLREFGSRCGKGAKQRGIRTPSLCCHPGRLPSPSLLPLHCKIRMTYTLGRVVPRMRVRSGNLPSQGQALGNCSGRGGQSNLDSQSRSSLN